jgi:uncharacterized protein (TIGR00255 family)
MERGVAGPPLIDESRFGAYVELLRTLREKFGIVGDIDIATVLRMPDVMSSITEGEEGDVSELIAVVERAADSLTQARQDEGSRLVAYLLQRVGVVEAALERIALRAPQRIIEQRDRLRENVRMLAEGVAVDDQRLAMEIAILADRVDVGEEVSRFRSHIVAFRQSLLGESTEGVGKRLGFVLQEMLREANTTGSKSNDSAMLSDVMTIKEELERIREQVENLE